MLEYDGEKTFCFAAKPNGNGLMKMETSKKQQVLE